MKRNMAEKLTASILAAVLTFGMMAPQTAMTAEAAAKSTLEKDVQKLVKKSKAKKEKTQKKKLKKLRDRLSAINAKIGGWKEGFDPFYGAPAILIVLADKNWANRVYDGSLVMGNMMLAAHSLNLGSIWIHRAKEEFELPEYQELLKEIGVEGEWEGIGHCAVGYVDGEFPKPAKRKDNRFFLVD